MIEEVAEDLEIIQRHCGKSFDLPAELTFKERVEMRVARLVIQGYVVAHPGAKELAFVLDGRDDVALREDLISARFIAQRMTEPFKIVVAGRTLTIGDVYVVDPAARPANGLEAIDALDRREAEGFIVRVRPVENPYFCLALADRPVESIDLSVQALWNLTGIEQPGVSGTADVAS
jgi:hypothetical protein